MQERRTKNLRNPIARTSEHWQSSFNGRNERDVIMVISNVTKDRPKSDVPNEVNGEIVQDSCKIDWLIEISS